MTTQNVKKALSAAEVLDYIYAHLKKNTRSHERRLEAGYLTADDTDQDHSSRRAIMKYNRFLFVKSGENKSWWLIGRGTPGGLEYLQESVGDLIAVKADQYPRGAVEIDRVLDRRFGWGRGDWYQFSAIVAMKDGGLMQSATSKFPTLASCAVFVPGCKAEISQRGHLTERVCLLSFLPPELKEYPIELAEKIAQKVTRIVTS
jgi:hypothetical protein